MKTYIITFQTAQYTFADHMIHAETLDQAKKQASTYWPTWTGIAEWDGWWK